MTEACREYAHLDGWSIGEFSAAYAPKHPISQLLVGGERTNPNFNPMGCHSEVFLHIHGMLKT